MKPKLNHRELPTQFCGQVLKISWFRKLTFRERIAILIGANFLVHVGIATQHRCGKYQPIIVGKVTESSTPDAEIEKQIENMLLAENKNQPPIEHDPR